MPIISVAVWLSNRLKSISELTKDIQRYPALANENMLHFKNKDYSLLKAYITIIIMYLQWIEIYEYLRMYHTRKSYYCATKYIVIICQHDNISTYEIK